ncbi:MAG TPA: hypothetical protein VGD80_40365, partial [Kofleriaceae bacterium]
ADGSIGTAHPILVEEIARDGSWLVVCQARQDTDRNGKISVGYGMHGDTFGDRLDPFLVFGSGTGSLIDSFVARDDDGAWFAVVRGGALELFDARHQSGVQLRDADVRDDGNPFGGARGASIAADGTRMIYFRHGGAGDRIVIRELASARERAVAVEGALWRAWVDDDGRWARVLTLPSGSEWPVAQTSLGPRGCRGPVLSYSTGGFDGARPTERWLDLERAAFVAAADLPSDVPDRFGHRRPRRAGVPMGAVWCGDNGACFDPATGKPLTRAPGTVEYFHGDRILIRSAGKLLVYDVSTRTSTRLPVTGKVSRGRGGTVAIGDDFYDLYTAQRVGSSRTDAVVAHAGKRVLLGHAAGACTPQRGDMPYACVNGVPNLAAGGRESFPIGPLHWAP